MGTAKAGNPSLALLPERNSVSACEMTAAGLRVLYDIVLNHRTRSRHLLSEATTAYLDKHLITRAPNI